MVLFLFNLNFSTWPKFYKILNLRYQRRQMKDINHGKNHDLHLYLIISRILSSVCRCTYYMLYKWYLLGGGRSWTVYWGCLRPVLMLLESRSRDGGRYLGMTAWCWLGCWMINVLSGNRVVNKILAILKCPISQTINNGLIVTLFIGYLV